MIRKIFAYQRVLLCSATPSEVLGGRLLPPGRTLFFFVLAACVALGPLLAFSMVNLAVPAASVWIVYRLLNGETRLFEQVPVSRRFTAANLLLFSLWLMAAAYVGLVAILLLMLAVIVLLALFFGSVQAGGPSDINPALAAGEWKNVVFSLLIYLLILCVGTALCHLRKKWLRLTSIGLFGAGLYAFLWAVKLSIPKVPASVPQCNGIDIMPYFSLHPHAQSILMVFGIVCAVLIPASVLFGFTKYTRRPR